MPDNNDSNIKLESLDESTSMLEKWLMAFSSTILFILIFITFIIDDKALLSNRKVDLPVVGLEIPLSCSALFLYGPFFFLLFHAFVFSVFYDFSTDLLKTNIPNLELTIKKYTVRYFLIVPFAQMILDKKHDSILCAIRLMIFWFLIFILPLSTLLWVQVSFIKYHEYTITWFQFGWILLEIVLLCLAIIIFIPPNKSLWQKETMVLRKATISIFILVFLISFIACYLAAKEEGWANFFKDNTFFNFYIHSKVLLTANKLPEEVGNNLNGTEQERLKALQRIEGIDLRDRNLQYANLKEIIMPKADLQGASLQYADLSGAQLQGANLSGANLQGANLSGAQLQYADLSDVQSQGINLNKANLQGISLTRANLIGANLSSAQLQGANLLEAKLYGANLKNVNLQGATLKGAQLQGVDLSYARLQGGDFREADLQGSTLKGASIGGASFDNVNLDFSDLRNLNISGLTKNDYSSIEKSLDESIDDQKKNILKLLYQIIDRKGYLGTIRSANQCLCSSTKSAIDTCLLNESIFYQNRKGKLIKIVCDNAEAIEHIVITGLWPS